MNRITTDSPESKSPDLVAENSAKLKELFPELLPEAVISSRSLARVMPT